MNPHHLQPVVGSASAQEPNVAVKEGTDITDTSTRSCRSFSRPWNLTDFVPGKRDPLSKGKYYFRINEASKHHPFRADLFNSGRSVRFAKWWWLNYWYPNKIHGTNGIFTYMKTIKVKQMKYTSPMDPMGYSFYWYVLFAETNLRRGGFWHIFAYLHRFLIHRFLWTYCSL